MLILADCIVMLLPFYTIVQLPIGSFNVKHSELAEAHADQEWVSLVHVHASLNKIRFSKYVFLI